MTATRLRVALLGVMALLALSACGGGGGGGGGSTTPPPAPLPPPPDSEPDAFTIQAVGDAPRGSAVASQAVQVLGINMPANVSIAGGEYSVNGGAFTSAAGTVANAQGIVVRVTAASAPGGVAEATLTVGSVAARFTVTTSTDVTPPTSTVVFPTARSRTSSEQLIVRGTASDAASPVTSVRVNGVEATSADNFATWTATVLLAAGANSIVVDAMDRALNRSAATPRADVTRNALMGFIEGLAVDTAQGRVVAADTSAGVLLSIDLASGLRTVIANATTPLISMAFDKLVAPSSVTLEAGGTHALVLDRSNSAILRVNLATGARTVVSGRGFPDSQNDFGNNAMAMSVDLANGRAYVLGRFPDAVYRVDLTTGVRTVLSDATTPNAADMFPNAIAMALDSVRGRLLVGDQGGPGPGENHAIYTVDLATGARGILSSNTVPNANNPLSFVGGFGIDGDRALVLQPFSSSILAVDLVTVPGNRTVFSSPAVPNGTNELEHVRAIAVDAANGRALVADFGTRSLVAVRLTDGARTLVSPNEPADIGARQRYSTGVALDLNANRIYVTDPADESRSLLAVDLATGDRTLVSSSTEPFGPSWFFPNAVAIDEPNNRFLVADLTAPAVYAVAFDTGARSVLSGNASQSGVAFVSPHTLAIDRDRNRALVADGSLNAVVAVSLTDGARTILSGPAVPPGSVELDNPYGLVIDAAGNRALVTHYGPPSVVAVDLGTGARTVLSTAGNTGTWLPQGIGIDAATRMIVTGDPVLGAVHVIDAVSGNRTLVSSSTIPRLNDHLKPRGVAVDGSRRIAWVTNDDFAILQIVDLVTGERVFLTR
jgi:sugar lactone lactonase YvrE